MKKKITKILLFVLPFMALILATTNNSVQLINMTTGEKIVGSYFTMLGDSTAAVCPVLAAMCSVVSSVAALVWLFAKKWSFMRISAWASFAGACIAVVPVAMRGDSLLLPHVIFPILLFVHFILCAFSKKLNFEEKEEPQGRRLERH